MKTAPEIIALHLGWDLEEVRAQEYQSGRYSCAVYTCNNDYYCCPPQGAKPPKVDGWKWLCVGTYHNRRVYHSPAAAHDRRDQKFLRCLNCHSDEYTIDDWIFNGRVCPQCDSPKGAVTQKDGRAVFLKGLLADHVSAKPVS
jgi:hypothetical protein